MKKARNFIIAFLIICGICSGICAAIVIYVDPYFHYHKPIEGMNYVMVDQRYINYGIVRSFDYDAMICGTSMTECFRTSVIDEEFGTTTVKVPLSGGSFCEVGELMASACEHNPDLKLVIRGLDCSRILNDKDARDYAEDTYPTYLYDDKYLNDVNYIFSKDALLDSVQNIMGRGYSKPISFDEYSNWNNDYAFGYSAILANYARHTLTLPEEQPSLTEEEREMIRENVTQNITDIADAYPDVEFYLFYTPYSIYYIDFFRMCGNFEKQYEAEKYATELLLEHPNIHIFSFYMEHEYIENADNYRDIGHYGQDMSDQIVRWMAAGKGELTKENYEEYYEEIYEYYSNLDYDAFFE